MDKMIYQHFNTLAIVSEIQASLRATITYHWDIFIYLTISFAVVQVLVILVIVPFISQINLLYEKVLLVLSRVTLDEC
jgi:hypothetical protein